MNEFTIGFLLVTLLGSATQGSAMEEMAVSRVQQTLASRYDPSLPNRSFLSWINQVVGPQSGVSWRLGECAVMGGAFSALEENIPACVEAMAILPDDRKVLAQIIVGYFKQGLSMSPRFYFAAIGNDEKFHSVERLRDLPQLLREPLPAAKQASLKIQKAVKLPQIRSGDEPRLYKPMATTILSVPRIRSNESAPPPPPPSPPPVSTVSQSVSSSEAIVKALPIYPELAKQAKATGSVEVRILIDERGHVAEANAIKGNPMLRSAAEEAAKKWLFKPALLDGKPVKQEGTLYFVFVPPK